MTYLPQSEAEWDLYFEIGADVSFERVLRTRGYRTLRGPNDFRGDEIGPLPSDGLLGLYREVYGDETVAVCLSLLNRLRSEIWRTQDSVEITPAEMTVSHAQNLKRWLERRARMILLGAQIEASCTVADHNGGDWAHDSLEETDRQLAGMDATDYLRELPLYQQIAARAGEAFVRG